MGYVSFMVTLYQAGLQIRMSSADPEGGGGSGKSRHHLPTSGTPLKWRFAGGPMVTRLDYWYGPFYPVMYED